MTDRDDADAALDRLLAASALTPPDDFLQRVMTALPPLQELTAEQPAPAVVLQPRRRLRRWLEAAALTGGALLGLSQLLAYVFGLWLATSTA